ncbi:MAG: hypothetical protein CBD16_06010 [Betaproteobacteria bacterium TMED156]|nr:MAG: hypothetical protein CBD16_06010 [Betaproteobacteria bacterium TMED156]|tara:strand:- start:396 stop:1097 length:702 start_codon:yes stop_codon:yes gene_type:complete
MYLKVKILTPAILSVLFQYSTAVFAQNEVHSKVLNSNIDVIELKTSDQILIDFLSGTNTLKADFIHEQTDSNGKIITFLGKVTFRRPDRLRWEVKKPYPQLQLLRGKEFLLYDPELEQVTVREIDASFQDSPAGLLFTSGPNAKKILMKRYDFLSAPDKDDLKWVLAVPKSKSNDNPTLEVGMDTSGNLNELISVDVFGRTSRIKLNNLSLNEQIKDVVFVPVIPSGVQYLKQ